MTEYVSMKRNASGYYDETAYKGVMGMAKPGEVWECVGNAGYASEYLIIKNHEKTCTALKITDCCTQGSIAVLDGYTDPRMVQYIYNNTLSQRKGAISEENLGDICYEIAQALDLPSMTVYKYTERPEPKKSETDFCEALIFREMKELFGDEAFEQYCRCAVYVCRCKGDAENAEIYLAALRALRGGRGEWLMSNG